MVFSSVQFLFLFLPAFLLTQIFFSWNNITFVLFSILFYFIGEGWFVALVLGSVGIRAAPVFVSGHKRLIWIWTNGLKQLDVPAVIDRAARTEHFDSIILLVNEGLIRQAGRWAASLPAPWRQSP